MSRISTADRRITLLRSFPQEDFLLAHPPYDPGLTYPPLLSRRVAQRGRE